MRLVCTNCGTVQDFPHEEIRAVPVERGDAQLFQLRHERTAEIRNLIFDCSGCKGIRARIDNPSQSAWAQERLTSTKVFDDPTPRGQINNRIIRIPMEVASAHSTLDEDAQQRLFGTLLLCGKKLAGVRKHMARYGEIEDRLIEREQRAAAAAEHHYYLEQAQDLFLEFDEFLVQIKSSLDYLVKVPLAILDAKHWPLRTFGDKGDAVVNALQRNMPAHHRQLGRGIAKMVVQKHQPWLESVIEARDRINHMIGRAIAPEEFMVFAAPREDSALVHIHRPRWSPDQTVRDFMEVIWENLIRLYEDFVMSILLFRFKPGLVLFHGRVEPGSGESPWRVTTEEERDAVVRQHPGWKEETFD